MNSRFDDKERLLLSHLDEDGTARGNKALREALRWGEKPYLDVRNGLLQKGAIALGRGRGGSVRRVPEDDEQALLAQVPVDGATVSNPKLIEHLGWSRDQYWKVRNRLVERGDLGISKGRGGSVFRMLDARKEREQEQEEQEEQQEEEQEAQEEIASAKSPNGRIEVLLYPRLTTVLETDWAFTEGVEDPVVAISAHHAKGKRKGGTWSRPDLIVVGQRSFDLLILEHTMVVWTFEVKAIGWNMKAIHEANANGRYATHACALLQVPDETPIPPMYVKEAERIGVGLITFIKPERWETWETLVPPKRHEPPEKEDVVRFLEQQIPDEIAFLKDRWRKRQASSRSHPHTRDVLPGGTRSCT